VVIISAQHADGVPVRFRAETIILHPHKKETSETCLFLEVKNIFSKTFFQKHYKFYSKRPIFCQGKRAATIFSALVNVSGLWKIY